MFLDTLKMKFTLNFSLITSNFSIAFDNSLFLFNDAVLISFVIIIFGVVFGDKKGHHYPLYVYMSIVGLVCMLLRQSTSGIMERVSNYFSFAEMVLVASSVSSIRSKRTQILVCMAVFVLCFTVALHKTSYSSLIPYKMFWQF